MADPDGIIVIVGVYDSVEAGDEDLTAIKLARAEHFIGDYEAALFEKTADGEVKIVNTDATQRTWGAKVGIVTGAVVGLIFPPSIIGMAAAGAGVGALAGNFMRGMKRDDVKAMGEMLDEGQAGLVVVGYTTIQEGMERYMKKAAKIMKKEVDMQADELKKAIDEAVK